MALVDLNLCDDEVTEFLYRHYSTSHDKEILRGINQYILKFDKADLFIDDRNIGGLPDWGTMYQMIKYNKSLTDILRERLGHISEDDKPKKKHWWQIG